MPLHLALRPNTPTTQEITMAHDTTTVPHAGEDHAPDAVESVVHLVPVVLPAVGAAMMLLLAFIAVYMA